MTIKQIRERIDAVYDRAVEYRRHLHMHPELSQEEHETMRYISEQLTAMGIPHQTGVGGCGVVGLIGDPNAAFAVGIRADIDALPITEQTGLPYSSQNPGVMHACGHDLHTATLLGTAMVLKGMESELPGAVKLFFQPAEEKGGGAQPMIDEGCLNDPPVRRALAFHADPAFPCGHLVFFPKQHNGSSTALRITVTGESSHGSRPDRGVDAIMVAGQILTALQTVVSRMVSPLKNAVVTVGTIHGGTKGNIIAGSVEMTGTIRALDLETRDAVKQKVSRLVPAIAEGFGAHAEVVIRDGYLPVYNDPATVQLVMDEMTAVVGAENITVRTDPGLGGEDFCYFANKVPSCYYRLGVKGADTGHAQRLHNEYLCPDEEAMKTGMLSEVLATIRLLALESGKEQ